MGNINCYTLDGKIVATIGQGDGNIALGVNPDGTEKRWAYEMVPLYAMQYRNIVILLSVVNL